MITLLPAERTQAGQYADELERAANDGERLLNSGQAENWHQLHEQIARHRLAARIIRAELAAQRPVPMTPANVAKGKVHSGHSTQIEPLDWHPDLAAITCASGHAKPVESVLVATSYRLPLCRNCADAHADTGIADLRGASDSMQPAAALV